MRNFNLVSQLELVECYALENGFISSEEKLSDIFDEDILPSVIEEYGADDQIAIDTTFNDWSDGICKDGYLHPVQYDEYIYVGMRAD